MRMAQAASANTSTKFGSALVRTTVDDEDALKQIAYHNQGNAELSTAENMRKRVGLRYASQVEDAIQAFWVVAKSTDAVTKETCVTQQGHEELYLRVHKALIEDFDLTTAKVDVFADWQNDTRGDGTLLRAGFGNSLFELTDVWSTGIGAEEYASFLWKLYEELTGVSRIHASSWRSMDQISYVGHLFSGVGAPPKARRQRKRAAECLQARMRGKHARDETRARSRAAACIQSRSRGALARKDQNQQQRAAAKIQALRRGQKARRETDTFALALKTAKEEAVDAAMVAVQAVKRELTTALMSRAPPALTTGLRRPASAAELRRPKAWLSPNPSAARIARHAAKSQPQWRVCEAPPLPPFHKDLLMNLASMAQKGQLPQLAHEAPSVPNWRRAATASLSHRRAPSLFIQGRKV